MILFISLSLESGYGRISTGRITIGACESAYALPARVKITDPNVDPLRQASA